MSTGKPVILKANNKSVNGIRIANGHHAMVLIGLDASGNGIFIDPWSAKINYAHGNGKTFKMKLETFVKNHMNQASGDYRAPYVTSSEGAGGYILVG